MGASKCNKIIFHLVIFNDLFNLQCCTARKFTLAGTAVKHLFILITIKRNFA